MSEECGLAQFHNIALMPVQRAMLEFLGNPAILGARPTPQYYIDGNDDNDIPVIAPPYIVSYLCPVVWVIDKPRAIWPNGDLHEISWEDIQPAPDDWTAGD